MVMDLISDILILDFYHSVGCVCVCEEVCVCLCFIFLLYFITSTPFPANT